MKAIEVMLAVALIAVIFLIVFMLATFAFSMLSDTQTGQAIDERIAEFIERRRGADDEDN
jgi:hypothetical protein